MIYRIYIQYSGATPETITPENRFQIIIEDKFVYVYDNAISIAYETIFLKETVETASVELPNMTLVITRDGNIFTNFKFYLRCNIFNNNCAQQMKMYIKQVFDELLPEIRQKIKSKCVFNIEDIYIIKQGEHSGRLVNGDSDSSDLELLFPREQIII